MNAMQSTKVRNPYDLGVARYRDEESLAAFGQAVRIARTRKGLSQAELADRAQPKLHGARLGDIERGEREAGLTIIVRLAKALDLTPAQLLAAMDEERAR